MFELRTYTLATTEALQQCETVHWARHIPTLTTYGITTHGIWRQVGPGQPHLSVLVSYREGADPSAVTAEYMGSQDFHDDMAGFPRTEILGVESTFLEPAENSPLR